MTSYAVKTERRNYRSRFSHKVWPPKAMLKSQSPGNPGSRPIFTASRELVVESSDTFFSFLADAASGSVLVLSLGLRSKPFHYNDLRLERPGVLSL